MTQSTRRSQMRRSETADRIRELILTRELRPGDPLPTETELCEALDVSRSSVREAIRSLATLDIVEVRHGHGTFVGQMSLAPMVEALVFRGVLSPGDNLRSLREIVEVRLALDLAMAERIVSAVAGTEQPELEELVAEMVRSADAGRTFLEADRAFHTRLLDAVDNQLAGQLVAAFWDVHTAVLPKLGLALPEDITKTAHAHGAMLAAARDGDLVGYRHAVITHYEPLQRMLDSAGR
jgi:Transcriptional regulators